MAGGCCRTWPRCGIKQSCTGRSPPTPRVAHPGGDRETPAPAPIAAARARVRRHVWTLISDPARAIPPSPVADVDLGKTVVIRMDATIQIAHSDKEGAAGTFKGSYGHHPLAAWCDNTGEALALLLRPGNAGSNTAADHITVLDEAIAQIPDPHRRDLLITVDGAGATLDLIRHITGLNAVHGRRVHYSVGFDLDPRARAAIALVHDGLAARVGPRRHPRDLDGDHGAGVVELTGLLRTSHGGDELRNWPADMRILCRRERPSAGAQLCALEEADGWRYQLVATNTPGRQLDFLEARHRAHARVEDRVRTGKTTGLDHLPSTSMAINAAWCVAAMIATDLLRWFALLCLGPAFPTPNPRRCATGCCTPPPGSSAANANAKSKSRRPGPGPTSWRPRSSSRSPSPPDLTTDTAHRPRPEEPHRPVEPAPPTRPSATPPRPPPEPEINNGGEDHQQRTSEADLRPSE